MANPDYDLIVIGGGPAGYAGPSAPDSSAKKWPASKWSAPGAPASTGAAFRPRRCSRAPSSTRRSSRPRLRPFASRACRFDFAKVMQRSRDVADQMAKGVEFLFKKNKVDYFVGTGQVTVPGMVEITDGRAQGQVLPDEEHPDRDRLQDAPPAGPAGRWRAGHDLARGAGRQDAARSRSSSSARRDRRRIRLFLQRLRHEGDAGRDAAADPAGRGRGGRPDLQRSFEKQGIAIHAGPSARTSGSGTDSVKLDLVKDGKTEEIEAETVLLGDRRRGQPRGRARRRRSSSISTAGM